MEIYQAIFENNPYPCFIFNAIGAITTRNKNSIEFLENWNENAITLSEKNLKILLYQNNLSLQNIEIFSNDKYFRFEVIKLSNGDFCFYGSNVTFQKNTADTLFNLIDDINEGLLLVDTDNEGQFVEVNNTAVKFLGYEREELLTMKLKNVVSNLELNSQRDWNQHAITIKSQDGTITKTGHFIRKDGSTFPVEMVISIRNVMEKDYQLTLIRDITQRLKEEKEKEELKINMFSSAKVSHLGEMATSIAHEINNPLTIIIGKTLNLRKMLVSKDLDVQKSLMALHTVESTVNRISKVIGSLRNISKSLEDDSFCNENISDMFADVINLYTERVKYLNVKLEITGEEKLNLLEVYCNRAQISQVLISLMNNSFEAITEIETRWLKINVDFFNEEVEISIKDSGKGITPIVLKNMFEPFYTTKPLGKGTGLGLAISKTTMNRHNGVLEYDKKSKNTCFIIKLPASKPST